MNTRSKKDDYRYYMINYVFNASRHVQKHGSIYYKGTGPLILDKIEQAIKEKYKYEEVTIYMRTDVPRDEYVANEGQGRIIDFE